MIPYKKHFKMFNDYLLCLAFLILVGNISSLHQSPTDECDLRVQQKVHQKVDYLIDAEFGLKQFDAFLNKNIWIENKE